MQLEQLETTFWVGDELLRSEDSNFTLDENLDQLVVVDELLETLNLRPKLLEDELAVSDLPIFPLLQNYFFG